MDTPTRRKPGTCLRWEKMCPTCGEWVGIGLKQNLYPFFVHLDGERCHQIAKVKARGRVGEAPSLSIIPMSDSSFKTSPQMFVPYPDVPTAVASPSPLAPSSMPSLIFPEESFRVLTAVPADPTAMDTPPALTSLPKTTALPTTAPQGEALPMCHGARVKWEHGHSSKTYPFQYHDTGYPTWSVSTQRPPDVDIIYLQSFSCTLLHDPSAEACSECLKLPSSNKFQSLVLKASRDPAPTVPWNYLSWEQIWQRLKDRTNECRRYRKKVSSVSPPQTHC